MHPNGDPSAWIVAPSALDSGQARGRGDGDGSKKAEAGMVGRQSGGGAEVMAVVQKVGRYLAVAACLLWVAQSI